MSEKGIGIEYLESGDKHKGNDAVNFIIAASGAVKIKYNNGRLDEELFKNMTTIIPGGVNYNLMFKDNTTTALCVTIPVNESRGV